MMNRHNFQKQIADVLSFLNCPNAQLLGWGNEGIAFKYNEKQIVKIYASANPENIEKLSVLQSRIASYHFPFGVPQIIELGHVQSTYYTIEHLLIGEKLDQMFSKLPQEKQYKTLANYLAALEYLHSIQLEELPYGQILQTQDACTASSWSLFLKQKVLQSVEKSKIDLLSDVENLEEKTHLMLNIIDAFADDPAKNFIHGDYYLGNVLFTKDLEIAAILDISNHAVVGDRHMDIAGAIAFLDLDSNIRPEHVAYLYQLAGEKYGQDIYKAINIYILYYSFYYSDTKQSDPLTYTWCVQNLNNIKKWQDAHL